MAGAKENLIKADRMVCECYDIRVKDIENEIRQGRTTFEDMVGSIRLGVMCSACIDDSKRVIEALTKRES